MNKIMTLTVATVLFLPQIHLYADDAHHPEKQGVEGEAQLQSKPAQQGMMGQMGEHMQKMMEQMDAVHKAVDPAEREKLLQEHMQSMQEGMGMMGGGKRGGMMMGKGMQQGSEMMGKRMQQGDGMTGCNDQKKTQHQQMERRMDMMQTMMDQMMQHQQAERPHKSHRQSK